MCGFVAANWCNTGIAEGSLHDKECSFSFLSSATRRFLWFLLLSYTSYRLGYGLKSLLTIASGVHNNPNGMCFILECIILSAGKVYKEDRINCGDAFPSSETTYLESAGGG